MAVTEVASGVGGEFVAIVALPGFVGQFLLTAIGDVVVAIGEFGDHRTRGAGFGLRHQPLQILDFAA